ncbi:hypothetical protein RvY_18885 [Ramazzottius varieornatus]|uniref:Uncharacterized protein n=1 Tax=Ramazzottius varieornatus TaxID=947166 RepID=A0A1D1W7E6_RAMVA|nr:hypothetical protein RvY_18885 [Ramazzottius varieornatus]
MTITITTISVCRSALRVHQQVILATSNRNYLEITLPNQRLMANAGTLQCHGNNKRTDSSCGEYLQLLQISQVLQEHCGRETRVERREQYFQEHSHNENFKRDFQQADEYNSEETSRWLVSVRSFRQAGYTPQ